jgi:coatomer subunit beta
VPLPVPAQVCRTKPDAKGKYIKIILALLQSPSAAVTYECAVTLTSLSQAPTAVRAAANCYCQLLVSQSDNNVKLIVLDRLQELKDKHRDVMQVRAAARTAAAGSCTRVFTHSVCTRV